ncbi:hypothetical protein [Ralstonia insidiosa]|nr:hypothetical protein [Ralstonia insidiosa]
MDHNKKIALYKYCKQQYEASKQSSIDYLFLLAMLIGMNALIIFGK